MNNEHITLFILVGCLGMTILASFIVIFVVIYQKKILAQQNQMRISENRHQRELLEAIIQVEDSEREKIAKNIHDDVGAQLNILRLKATKIMRNTANPGVITEAAQECQVLLDDCIENIRGIARNLAPATLLRLGYLKGIGELCRHISSSGTVGISFSADQPEARFPQKTELQLYRITLEIITNIIRHARASAITLTVSSGKKNLLVFIAHNGKGITSEKVRQLRETPGGIGLKSIESRAQLINAAIQYISIGENRSHITIEVPLYEEEN